MTEWSQEQILQQAQGNGNAITLGTIAYLNQTAQPLKKWANFIGERFSSGWTDAKGESARTLVQYAVFNPISMGGSLVSLEGDKKSATAIVDFPIGELATSMGVSLDDVDTVLTAIFEVIFASLDVNFESQREGERWTYTVSY